MTLQPALCLALGLISLAACSSPQSAQGPAPASTGTALQGTWRSVDDAKSMMTIRDTTVTESYLGEEPSVSTLKIVADCNEQAPDPALLHPARCHQRLYCLQLRCTRQHARLQPRPGLSPPLPARPVRA